MCFRKFLVSKTVKDKRERGGASRLSVEILLSHSSENLRRGNLCFRKFLVSKNVRDKRERRHHDFPSKLCCLTVPKNFVGETRVSESFWYRKLLRIIERGGASRLSVEILLSHSTENLRRGNLCFRKFLVSKNVRDKRERRHQDFPSKLCCLTVPSNFVGETCVSESFWYRKLLTIRERGGGASRLSVEILLSHSTENLRRGNLRFRKFLVSKNVRDKRERRHHDFPSKLCCLTVPKNFVGETRVSESFWYRKLLRIRERGGGGITTFCRNFVVSQYRKSSSGKLVFQKVSGIEKC